MGLRKENKNQVARNNEFIDILLLKTNFGIFKKD